MRDSLTWALPSSTTPSATIWSPAGKLHDVVLHELFREARAPGAAAQAAHLAGRDQRQRVDGLFGAQLLRDTDDRVAENDAEEAILSHDPTEASMSARTTNTPLK